MTAKFYNEIFTYTNQKEIGQDFLRFGENLSINDKVVVEFPSHGAVIVIDVIFPKIDSLVENITTKMFNCRREKIRQLHSFSSKNSQESTTSYNSKPGFCVPSFTSFIRLTWYQKWCCWDYYLRINNNNNNNNNNDNSNDSIHDGDNINNINKLQGFDLVNNKF